MVRPKESTYGVLTGLASLYSANKVRKLGSQYEQINMKNSEVISHEFTKVNTGIRNLGELSIATMAGVYELDIKVGQMVATQSAIMNHFENERLKNDHLGNLKLFMREVKKEIQHIRTLYEEYPVWAVYLAKILRDMFNERAITIEQFKDLQVSEIDWAEEIIEDVKSLHSTLYDMLE